MFTDVLPELKGLEWGRLHETYHGKSYDPKKMSADVKKLAAEDYLQNNSGILPNLTFSSPRTMLGISSVH